MPVVHTPLDVLNMRARADVHEFAPPLFFFPLFCVSLYAYETAYAFLCVCVCVYTCFLLFGFTHLV